jgi:hypothetical protein
MKHEYDYYYLLTTIMQYQVLMDEYSKYLIQLLMDYIYPYSFIHFIHFLTILQILLTNQINNYLIYNFVRLIKIFIKACLEDR